MKTIYNIAISCIGSGVGQSIITSCRLSNLPIRTIGFGTNPFAFGMYECQVYDETPSIYADNYVDVLLRKCKEHDVDLLIPCLDDEAHIISKAVDRFRKEGIEVIVAGEEFLSLCRNKQKLTEELNPIADIFVKSYSKQDFINRLHDKEMEMPVIAKPRNGCASRGIVIVDSKEKIYHISDEHIVQELAVPHAKDPNRSFYLEQIRKNNNPQVSEISIQLVTDKYGNLVGRAATYNKLNNGVPIEIVPFEDERVWESIKKIYPALKSKGMRGPVNLQGRITDSGLKIFEVNARFTGVTGLRAMMGFNEVEYCIKHWLGIAGHEEKLHLNPNRFGVRQTADKVIPIERNKKVEEQFLNLNTVLSKGHKVLLITGASGYLAQNLIAKLAKDSRYQLWAFSRNKEKAKALLPHKNIQFYDKSDFQNGNLSLGNVDVIVHSGFGRPHCGPEQIADSLAFTGELFTKAAMCQVPAIINISSQSVYGLKNPPPWKEGDRVAPDTPYGQAKYASELMLLSLTKMVNHIKATSIRLTTITGGQPGLVTPDLTAKFAQQALKAQPIHIEGGNQELERMDVRDAVTAICKLLEENPENWKPAYNLGIGKAFNIVDIAKLAVEVAQSHNGGKRSAITINEKETALRIGMDSTLFKNDFHWQPKYELRDILESLVERNKAEAIA